MQDREMKDMLIEYMGTGFLENIIALFRQDGSLYRFIPDMLGHDGIRVRLGVTALVEELAPDHAGEFKTAVPGVIELLKHDNPAIRGDAAYVLGLVKDQSAREPLTRLLNDGNAGVREAAADALADLDKAS